MKRIAFGFFVLVAASCTPQISAADPAQIYMPDGQLMSHPIRVYVSGTNLTEAQQPKLRLAGQHVFSQPDAAQQKDQAACLVVSEQSWNEVVAGQTVSREGTLLLFDLSHYPVPWYKATIRFDPWLSWSAVPPGQEPAQVKLVGKSVYLGRLWVAFLWTSIVVGTLVLAIWSWSVQKKKGHGAWLICGEDGYLSVWRTQLAAWTIAVGGLVFCFGLLRLEVPTIPESLVALMGMSVATGGFSSAATRSLRKGLLDAGKQPPLNPEPPQLSNLISSYSPTSPDGEVSISKAQMVFWTGIILVLFIAKSLLIGELWPVPWEMVALTGVSQVGYVSDKAAKHKALRKMKSI